MTLRLLASRAGGLSLVRRAWPKPQPQSRWLSCGRSGGDQGKQSRFTYYAAPRKKLGPESLLSALREDVSFLTNPPDHNAAVLLATPNYAKHVCDHGFVGEAARLLCRNAHVDQYHVLCAVVDNVAPLSYPQTERLQGVSILRGHVNDILPGLWDPQTPDAVQQDAESPTYLIFKLGRPSAILPLAPTPFENGRPHTLVASCFNLTSTSAKLVRTASRAWQHVNVSVQTSPNPGLGVYAPLLPLTQPRRVTDSYGNIVRQILLDRVSVPASTELESAVEMRMQSTIASTTPVEPLKVWAIVTINHAQGFRPSPRPLEARKRQQIDGHGIRLMSLYADENHRPGSRFYQVLSGGGGWGPRKGLLALDPVQTYMFHSDQEIMVDSVNTMGGSGFTPSGCEIQFFTPLQKSPGKSAQNYHGVILGTPHGKMEDPDRVLEIQSSYLKKDQFGALSTQGVFISGPRGAEDSIADRFKMDVPGSRVYADAPAGAVEGDDMAGVVEIATAGAAVVEADAHAAADFGLDVPF